jgi:hypothetical protein
MCNINYKIKMSLFYDVSNSAKAPVHLQPFSNSGDPPKTKTRPPMISPPPQP